jgi:hypothetical protein
MGDFFTFMVAANTLAHCALTSAAIQLGTVTDLTDTRIYVHKSNSSPFVERLSTSSEKNLVAATASKRGPCQYPHHQNPSSLLSSLPSSELTQSSCPALNLTSIIYAQKLR